MTQPQPPKTGMPDWLRQHLETKTGGFRNARWQRCPNCQQLTLHGLDNDLCAYAVTVDPTELTPAQEGEAAINGRRTYSLDTRAKTHTIWMRDPYAIGRPFSRPIVPAHKCGDRYPGFLLKPPAAHTRDQQPPF